MFVAETGDGAIVAKIVSVIIPTKDRCHLCLETLTSLINQSYMHWEALVVDDGSTDNTVETIGSTFVDEQRSRQSGIRHPIT